MGNIASNITAKDQAEYALKSAVCRIECAFQFIHQHRASWKFPVLFVSDSFASQIQTASEYFPLNSSWYTQANQIIRQHRYGRALVVFQSGSSSSFWKSVTDFMACYLASSMMNKGDFIFGTGTRGRDVIDLSFYSAHSKTGQAGYRMNPHYCEVNSLHDWVVNGVEPGTEHFRGTLTCLTFFDYQPQQKSKVQVPLNEIYFCKTCGKSYLATADYSPSALERMYKYVIKGV
jgi:hypothetical protein